MSEKNPRIGFVEDGPIVVNDIDDLRNSRGEALPAQAEMYLCRCGASRGKPFCDGSHQQAGFRSARQADPAANRPRDYPGKTVTVHDNRFFCSHAGHCTHLAPGAFDVRRRPWIDADGEAEDRLLATIAACPSGALAYTRDGVLHRDDAERKPAIHLDKDGPYLVVGGPALATDIQPPSPEHYALCRCGASRNLPYCDGSHLQSGFRDEDN